MISSTRVLSRFNEPAGGIRVVALSTIAVVAALLVLGLAVLPAGAAFPDSAAGIVPVNVNLGGQPNDCDAGVIDSDAAFELRIENPQNGVTYPAPGIPGAEVTLTVVDDEFLDFAFVGGAAAYDVVIKGGKKSTHWDYDGTEAVGPSTADQQLHAPPKGQNLYSISHVSFCYDTAPLIVSGTVFDDTDFDGVFDSGESGEPGIEVTVYYDGTSASQTTDGDGTYSFNLQADTAYTVCEESRAAHGQTLPTGNTECEGQVGSHESAGYSGTLTANETLNFGNALLACGQNLIDFGGVFTNAQFTVFADGNNEVPCEDKFAILTIEDDEVGFILTGNGTAAAIGILEKDFGSNPPAPAFEPLEYAQFLGDSFEDVPWCVLRPKMGVDGNEFDPYLTNTSVYPTVTGVTDPSGDPSTACKVFEEEKATGEQKTVLYVADDPFFQ